MPEVKICGICNIADAEKSVELGADFLGFIFAESPRQIQAAQAKLIRKKIGNSTKFVGVFKNQDPRFINDTAELLRLDYVQLHGNESPDYCRKISMPVIKALELDPAKELPNLAEFNVHAFLFDRPKTNRENTWLHQIVETHGNELLPWQPFFIAGGLTAENVRTAMMLNPFAIDVASGVESSPGVKNHDKLVSFFQAIKGAGIC